MSPSAGRGGDVERVSRERRRQAATMLLQPLHSRHPRRSDVAAAAFRDGFTAVPGDPLDGGAVARPAQTSR